MWTKLYCFILSVLASPAPAASESFEPGCNSPPGIQSLWEKHNLNFVIIGEIHGTSEMPAAFGEIVCSAIANRKKVIVGLEFPEQLQQSFEAYMESEGNRADQSRFLRTAFSSDILDGTESIAIFHLVERLRKLHRISGDISITTYQRFVQYDRAKGQTPSERAKADVLRETYAVRPDAVVLVLTGNIHARRKAFPEDGRMPDLRPMAMHLPAEETLSLVFIHTGGSAWTCSAPQRDGGAECGSSKKNPSRMGHDVNDGLTMMRDPDRAYDGIVQIGPITASAPAKHCLAAIEENAAACAIQEETQR